MGFLHNLKLKFAPPTIIDPDFGKLRFMYIPPYPERSYWECEWTFPGTENVVSIGLPGTDAGPLPEARDFYLGLPERIKSIIDMVQPQLGYECQHWLGQELPENLETVFRLSGFDLQNPLAEPLEWSVSFESIGEKWISVTVPFENDKPGDAVVDT